ncbi:MAG: surface-adhesin E family protein [Syntrophaceae bacterium]
MKIRLLPILFLFLMCLSFVRITPGYAESRKEKWVFMGFTKYRDALYIETNSITHSSQNIYWVWSLMAPSEKSRYLQQVKNELQKSNKSTDGLKYIEVLNQIDCTNKRIRSMRIEYLTIEGKMIHFAEATDQEWKTIYPGSLWHAMQNAACGK